MSKVNNFVEFVKTNKKSLVKKALVIGGSVLGLAIVAKLASKPNDDVMSIEDGEVATDEVETGTEESVQ